MKLKSTTFFFFSLFIYLNITTYWALALQYDPNCGIKGPKTIHSSEHSHQGHQDNLGIVNGTFTVPNEWPWVVALGLTDNDPDPLFHLFTSGCEGAIIHPEWILTAATCYIEPSNHTIGWDAFFAAVAGAFCTNIKAIEPTKVMVNISKVFSHPDFKYLFPDAGNRSIPVNDIALVKLVSPLNLTTGSGLGSVCLPPPTDAAYDAPAGRMGTVAGWGSTDASDKAELTMMVQVKLPLVSMDWCMQRYVIPDNYTDLMLCSYALGRDTCIWDTGAPLVVKMDDDEGDGDGDGDGRWQVAGMASWEYDCARKGYPSVLTNVAHYLDWIEKIISEN